MPSSPIGQVIALPAPSLFRVLEPAPFERLLAADARLPDPAELVRALPGHHRFGARARRVEDGIELRCPIPGLVLHAAVGRDPKGSVLSGTLDLLPGFRLLLAALFVCLAALAIALPLKVLILMTTGAASAATLAVSVLVSLVCLGSGALMAAAQAAGRRSSEYELLDALASAERPRPGPSEA